VTAHDRDSDDRRRRRAGPDGPRVLGQASAARPGRRRRDRYRAVLVGLPRLGRPVDPSTLFQIASITKTFTATAVVRLRDAGLLSLEDRLVDHVPEATALGVGPGVRPEAVGEITLRQLLQHVSGLQGEALHTDPRLAPNIDQGELLTSLGRMRVVQPPGSAFRYSNLGFRLLAEVVGRVSGMRWPEYARRELLEPLGMTSSGAFPGPDLTGRLAQGHVRGQFDDTPVPVPAVDTRLAEGDGDLWSCLDDLVQWVTAQFAMPGRPAVLAPESVREMQQPTVIASEKWSEARCLGWGAVRREWGVLVGHGGLLDGYNSNACFSAKDRVGVVSLTNGVPKGSVADLAWVLADHVVAATRAAAAAAGPHDVVPVPEHYAELLGRYQDPLDGEDARIEFRRGRLVCPDAETEYELEPTDDPLVFVVDHELWRFLRSADTGRVDGLNAHGYPLVRRDS
jgi:CubicO group peptidase (beta-lactamase class C family)